jgi:hypothetical protein
VKPLYFANIQYTLPAHPSLPLCIKITGSGQ